MKLSGSDIIVECLLEQGADTIFGYPGGAVLNIYDSLYKYSDKIRHVITCHEQGACHAADGHAPPVRPVSCLLLPAPALPTSLRVLRQLTWTLSRW